MAPKSKPLDYQEMGKSVEDAMAKDDVDLTPASAWNFLYRYGMGVQNDLPHIVEANDLSKPAWKIRAQRVLSWLQTNLVPGKSLTPKEALDRLDTGWRAAKEGGYSGTKSNLAGSSLEYALSYLIEKFCGVQPLVGKSIRLFRGYEIAKRAEVEQLDIAMFSYDDFRLFLSAFWTTRKDRIAADLYEATFLRRRRPDIGVAFVVNEFRQNLLNHLLEATDVDRVYHVCIDALLAAHLPFEALGQVTTDQLLARSPETKQYYSYLSLRETVFGLETLFEDITRLRPEALAQ